MARGFTPLEQAVLDAICEMYPAETEVLRAQLATAVVTDRENTGGGFHTEFSVDRAAAAPVAIDRRRDGPLATINGVKDGMGFILWLEDGYADCLEGFAAALCDQGTTDLDLAALDFEIQPFEPGVQGGVRRMVR